MNKKNIIFYFIIAAMVILLLSFIRYNIISCLVFLELSTFKVISIVFGFDAQFFFFFLDQDIITIDNIQILILIFGFIITWLFNCISFKFSTVFIGAFILVRKICAFFLGSFSEFSICFDYLSLGISIFLIFLINLKIYRILKKKIHYTSVTFKGCDFNSYWFIFRCVIGLVTIRHSVISTNTNILKFVFVISIVHIAYFIIKQWKLKSLHSCFEKHLVSAVPKKFKVLDVLFLFLPVVIYGFCVWFDLIEIIPLRVIILVLPLSWVSLCLLLTKNRFKKKILLFLKENLDNLILVSVTSGLLVCILLPIEDLKVFMLLYSSILISASFNYKYDLITQELFHDNFCCGGKNVPPNLGHLTGPAIAAAGAKVIGFFIGAETINFGVTKLIEKSNVSNVFIENNRMRQEIREDYEGGRISLDQYGREMEGHRAPVLVKNSATTTGKVLGTHTTEITTRGIPPK